jgi:hypothetical protein
MTLPAVELSKDQAYEEAESFFAKASGMSVNGQLVLLRHIFQRIYQEGVTAGHERCRQVVLQSGAKGWW